MADATLPTSGPHAPGHVPFHLRVRHRMRETDGRVVDLVAVEGHLATIRDRGREETLWTHGPAARALATGLDHGVRRLSRFGGDLFIMSGFCMSLVDPAEAAGCRNEDECGHGRLISVATGEPWDVEDTLRLREERGDATSVE